MGRFIKLTSARGDKTYVRADCVQGIDLSRDRTCTYLDMTGESGWYVKETVSEVMDLVNQSLLEMTDA